MEIYHKHESFLKMFPHRQQMTGEKENKMGTKLSIFPYNLLGIPVMKMSSRKPSSLVDDQALDNR